MSAARSGIRCPAFRFASCGRHSSHMVQGERMPTPVRRVVTGHDAQGKAIVLIDGDAPNQKVRQTGIVSTLLWVTDEAPADICGSADRAAREIGVPPPAN